MRPPLGCDQPVQQLQKKALARAVGPHDHRAARRPRDRGSTPSRATVSPHRTGVTDRAPRSGSIGTAGRRCGSAAVHRVVCRASNMGHAASAVIRSECTSRVHPEGDRRGERRRERGRSARSPLRGLERDGRGHHPRDVVDVAAHDDDRADLGDRAAEAWRDATVRSE